MKQESKILKDQTLGEKLIKKGFWLYFFSFLVAPAGYLVKLFVSNSLPVADVGLLYSIISLITLLNTYNDLGLTESLQYFLPRFLIKKQYNFVKTSIYFSLAIQIITAIIIACVLWFTSPWLANNYFHSESAIVVLKYFCFYFLGINLFQTLQSIFVAIQDTFSQQFIEFVRQWSIFGFTVLFFFTGNANIQRYSLNRIFGLLIGIVVALVLFYNRHAKELLQGRLEYNKIITREYIKYALWCFIGLEVSVVFGNIVQQFVVIFLGAESAGYYTNFTSLFLIVALLVGPIIGLIFPMVSEIIAKNDKGKLKSLYTFFYTYLTIAIIILLSYLIPLGEEVGFVLLGTKFAFSGKLLSYGVIFSYFSIFSSFNFSVLAGIGKIKERVKYMGIALISTLIMLFSIKWIGIYGGVLSLGAGYVVLWLFSFFDLYHGNRFSINWKLLINNIVICIIMGLVIWRIKDGIFVFDDLERYRNLGKLIIIAICMCGVFVIANVKQILSLKKEILKLKE